MSTNLTADAVVQTANHLLSLLAVINPAAAGAAVAAQGALTLLNNTLLPEISRMFNNGEISVEEQDAVRAGYDAFRDNFDAMFEGDQWKIRPDTPPES